MIGGNARCKINVDRCDSLQGELSHSNKDGVPRRDGIRILLDTYVVDDASFKKRCLLAAFFDYKLHTPDPHWH